MDESSRTLVCSILFLDIVGYSRRGVDQQVRLKQMFNAVLRSALEQVEERERVIVDTGDGAAVAFLGDPESALFAALAVFDNVGEMPVRMGINLGPVSLMQDINGSANVVGDGINVAQRVMDFARQGELLVSRSFYDVVSFLSADYSSMFRHEGVRTDKHQRLHELYAMSEAVRVGRRLAEAQARLRSQRRPIAEAVQRVAAVRVSDAGTHFIISGTSETAVQQALERLADEGCKALSPITRVGAQWLASVTNPKLAVAASVEEFGLKRVVTGPTREVVEAKVRELCDLGARLVQDIELVDGVWNAVCERT